MRRRTYLRTTAGTAVGLGLVGRVGARQGGQEIVAGTAPGFPPFEMREEGELVGFDIALLEAVVEQTDYTLTEWRAFEFSSLIPALTTDRIDVIAAAMTITEERDGTIDFTDPYYNADQSVLVRADGDFQPESLEDLADHPVGAQQGTTGEGQVQMLIENGTIQQGNYNSYGNYVLAVQDLQNGNIDAVVLDQPVAQTFADQRPVEVAFVVETGERYGFGVREDADDLTEALNEGLAAVREENTYEELRNEWFGPAAEGVAGNETAGNATTGNLTIENVTTGNATAGGNATASGNATGGDVSIEFDGES